MHNTSKWILFLFGLSLPFPIVFNRITVGLLLVHSLIVFCKRRPARYTLQINLQGPWILLMFFAVYLVTDLLSATPHPWQVVDTYFLFPILGIVGLLLLNNGHNVDYRGHFLKGLLIGNLISGLLCIVRAFVFSVKITDDRWEFDSSVWGDTPLAESVNNYGNYFFSEFFSWFLHPSYASLYLELSL